MTFLRHSMFMAIRHLRALWRQPWYVAVTLVQPVIWILLFGALFQRVVEIPGFATVSYIDFLTPGVVVMTALFSSGWLGMSIVQDLDHGVLDRFLVSPVSRGALIAGLLGYNAVVATIQSIIVVVIGALDGAKFAGGMLGILILIAVSVLLGAAFGAFSTATALLTRKEETLIAAANFLVMPLTFLSSAFMQQNLVPKWIQNIAPFNPVNWAVQGGRDAVTAQFAGTAVLQDLVYLLLLAIVCGWLSTRAFRAYQRSI
ncbi:MAG: ABC transporter permease [Chloroflexi bacterium]|nr:ABC transporter permease [Chloroflexota bacterium]